MIEYLLLGYIVGALIFAFVNGLVVEMYSSLDFLRPKAFDRSLYYSLCWPLCFMFVLGCLVYDAYKNFNPRGNF